MPWFYERDGRQAGPVSDSELKALIDGGEINGSTPVKREETAEWQPLAAVWPPVPPPLPEQRPGTLCVECGRTFPPDELITLNKTLVCAECKPVVLQRMVEGALPAGAVGLWREGKKLVTRSETPFPDHCVKCNAPANGYRLKRVLYWHHPAYYLLIFCYLFLYIIAALIVRRKATLHVGLCDVHRRERRTALVACATGFFGGFALTIVGAIETSGWLVIPGVLAVLVGVIWGIVKGRVVYATKITKEFVWLGGVGREFLEKLPER